jgi:uncharacterized membrane protein YfcA
MAGAVNSVAGGGTLLTFPALIWSGQLANVANATSTVALWPGQLSSLWGYRREIGRSRQAIVALGLPSLLGGGVGALLFSHTSSALFARLVPFLILLATLLFMAQGPLSRRLKRSPEPFTAPAEATGGADTPATSVPGSASTFQPAWIGVMLFQFAVAIYGGYFGAGIGILMLAALGFMGFSNIHRMNGLKNLNGLLINLVAIVIFLMARTAPGQGVGPGHDRLVDWSNAALMAAGSIVGGYAGSGTARRIGQQNVRRIVIFIGFALTLSLLIRQPGSKPSPAPTKAAHRPGVDR